MKQKLLVMALILACFGAPESVSGQPLTVALNVTSQPNPYISEWASRRETAILTITNPSSTSLDVRIMVRILVGSELRAETRFEELPTISVPARSTRRYYSDEIVPFGAMRFFGGVEGTTLRTGQLPAGSYTFCVKLLDPISRTDVSAEVCRPFIIQDYQRPSLLQPGNGTAVTPESRPTFRWTPVSPAYPTRVTYRFLLFEVLAGQDPIQAFRGNQPVAERLVAGSTQLIWLPDLLRPDAGKTYVWTVQSLDANGTPIGDQEGYADPFTFTTAATKSANNRGWENRRAGRSSTADRTGQSSPRLISGTGSASSDNHEGETSEDNTQSSGGSASGQSEGGQEEASEPEIPTNPTPEASTCSGGPLSCPEPTDLTASNTPFAEGDGLTICGFTMILTSPPTGSASALTGNGSIWIPWMRANLAVSFTGIKVNAANEIFDGAITSQVDPDPDAFPLQWAQSVGASSGLGSQGLDWTHAQVKKLDQWLHDVTPEKLKDLTEDVDRDEMLSEQTSTSMTVPIGFNNVEGATIIISEMKFEPTGAHLNTVATFPVSLTSLLPADYNDTLSFRASGIPFGPGAPGIGAGTLALLADQTLTHAPSGSPSYELKFKAASDGVPGTYISWDCKGFRELNLDVEVIFPREWLRPIPDNNTASNRVTARSVATVVSWKDWMLTASLPRCEIANTNGLQIEVPNMILDHSEVRNPTMTFPEGYINSGPDFMGFYMQLAKVVLPENLRTFQDQPVKVNVTNMIIDETGMSCNLVALNVLNFPNANVADMGASIERIELKIMSGSLENGKMLGRIVLPLSEPEVTNTIGYSALFSTVNGFQFTMQPDQPIETTLLSAAKLRLEPTSVLTLSVRGDTTEFNTTLNGRFDWDDVKIGEKVRVSMKDLTFEEMTLDYNNTDGFDFNSGTWSFASPQKWISGFPVTIERVKFETLPRAPGELLAGALAFDVKLNLSDNLISGRTRLAAKGAIQKPMSFRPVFKGVSVRDIDIRANLSAVKMDGKVKLYNDDPVFGDGFEGSITAVFNSLQMQIDASARFGTAQATGTPYRYWGVEAKAILPKPGIVFLPGMAFYGFGVGASRRMNVTAMPTPDPQAVAGATSTSAQTSSGAVFTPDNTKGFDFKVTGVMGNSPDPRNFNADVSLRGQFGATGGLQLITVGFDGWVAASLLERNQAPVSLSCTASYSPPTKIFDLNAMAQFRYPADGSEQGKIIRSVGSGVNLKLHIDGGTGKWFFKLGSPPPHGEPNTVVVMNALTVQQYLMFGNNIQPQEGFLPSTVTGLQAANVSMNPADFHSPVSNEASLGTGFAAGITVFGNSSGEKSLMDRAKLEYQASGGFEINTSMLRYPPATRCNGVPLGMNGWYARAGVATWFSGVAGIRIAPSTNRYCLLWCKGYYLEVLRINLGVRLNGGFPRPGWVHGQASGEFNVCEGLFKGSFTADLKIGEECNVALQAEHVASHAAEDAASTIARDGTLILSAFPANKSSGFNPDQRLGASFGFKPNDVFDVFERQGDGTVRKRTFQARYTATLDSLGPADRSVAVAPSPSNAQTLNTGMGGFSTAPSASPPPAVANSAVATSPPAASAAMPRTMRPGITSGATAASAPAVAAAPTATLTLFGQPIPAVLRRSTQPSDLGEFQYWLDRGGSHSATQWVPNLSDTTAYRFRVTGELWERTGTGTWTPALTRNGAAVSETRTVLFSTGVSLRPGVTAEARTNSN